MMADALRLILEFIRDHWHQLLVSLVSIALGAWWGRRRAKRDWARKEFLDRINFSLNSIVDGTLHIRTLIEKNTSEVFLNKVATDMIREAAGHTTAQSALLHLEGDNRWFLLNGALNALSEKFADGFLQRDLGLPSRSEIYLICLTYESVGDLKTRKIRVMMIRKNLLVQLPAEEPSFERPHHKTRWLTLNQLAAAYAADRENFLEVELVLPVGT